MHVPSFGQSICYKWCLTKVQVFNMSSDQFVPTTSPKAPSFFGFWAPGARLMGNVTFPVKAIIISLIFLLPVALLGYFFVSAQNDQIAFSAKERVGVQTFENLVPLSSGILQIRKIGRAHV